ncbi:MAG: hypothetical protein K2X29_05585 [Candidatus Obscuribacterales bacterium]|jgi:hypothetical protein|nr:hypothetical protein [Candidatus Obscuribacterales bacterium]
MRSKQHRPPWWDQESLGLKRIRTARDSFLVSLFCHPVFGLLLGWTTSLFFARSRSFPNWFARSRSSACLSLSAAHFVTSSLLIGLFYIGAPREPTFPSTSVVGDHRLPRVLPPPDASTHVLFSSLTSPMSYTRFLAQYGVRVRATGPVDYIRRYRLNLEEFRAGGWLGDCNDFANTIAEMGYRQGYPMGLLSMWPARWQDRLSKDWHQAAVMCLQHDREYLVFDFDEVIHWKGTLEEYAQSQRKSVLPMGGVLDWRPTKQNPLARFMDHLRSNQSLPEFRLPVAPVQGNSVT